MEIKYHKNFARTPTKAGGLQMRTGGCMQVYLKNELENLIKDKNFKKVIEGQCECCAQEIFLYGILEIGGRLFIAKLSNAEYKSLHKAGCQNVKDL